MTGATPSPREAPPSVLARATAILDAVQARGPVATLGSICATTGLARSTAHRLCAELVDLGHLVQEPRGYRLGPHLHRLGQGAVRGQDLRVIARPFMEDLRLTSGGATVQLAVLDGVEIVKIEVFRAAHPPKTGARAGARLPAHATASGKAILAYARPELVQARIDAGLTRLTPRTLGTAGALRRALAEAKARGVAYDREESALGLHGVAAPVFGRGERIVAALSVSGLEARDLAVMAPAVRMAAIGMSRTLGAFAHPVGGSSHAASVLRATLPPGTPPLPPAGGGQAPPGSWAARR